VSQATQDTHADHGHDHGFGHVATPKVLLGTWAILMILTVVTVLAIRVDLGANWNLVLAMVIATVKATLVCLYFMHLRYDRLFHTVVFISAILLATLFVTFSLMDSHQYQPDVAWEKDEQSPAPY
jgi:cytochrome c oxidase subunit 4